MMEIWPGDTYPLGATPQEGGTNFAVFTEHGEGVDLCLFDEAGNEECHPLEEARAFVWHGFVPGVSAGQRYGFRVRGPYRPSDGLRFNPNKLLLDPYAKAIEGDVDWGPEAFGYAMGSDDLSFSEDNSAARIPRCIVVDDAFDWAGDAPLRRPWHETVIYETHVKGFTKLHEGIPEDLRGTYAGLAHPSAIEHLQLLGISAIELMPVHHFIHPQHLTDQGLRNYWGDDSIGYLAPYSGYSSAGGSGGQVAEFKDMVKSLHAAGIEVILDVVYTHTGEGNHLGPTISFRGLDNTAYYRLV